jgi:hypothetical protein
MAEFEDKLNAILGDQQAMGQIMALARSLSGEASGPQLEQPEQSEESKQPEQTAPAQPIPELDPQLLRLGGQLAQKLQGGDERTAALLQALRPFLREERRAKLDRAIQLTQMTRLIRATLGLFGGKGEEDV